MLRTIISSQGQSATPLFPASHDRSRQSVSSVIAYNRLWRAWDDIPSERNAQMAEKLAEYTYFEYNYPAMITYLEWLVRNTNSAFAKIILAEYYLRGEFNGDLALTGVAHSLIWRYIRDCERSEIRPRALELMIRYSRTPAEKHQAMCRRWHITRLQKHKLAMIETILPEINGLFTAAKFAAQTNGVKSGEEQLRAACIASPHLIADDAGECNICYECNRRILWLLCGHELCPGCISAILVMQCVAKCPFCRRDIIAA